MTDSDLISRLQSDMQAAMKAGQKDRELLQMRFAEAMTQKEIGLALGVSQMQVSRLVRAVLEKLRAQMGVTVDEAREVVAAA